jgi:hypothetical protein
MHEWLDVKDEVKLTRHGPYVWPCKLGPFDKFAFKTHLTQKICRRKFDRSCKMILLHWLCYKWTFAVFWCCVAGNCTVHAYQRMLGHWVYMSWSLWACSYEVGCCQPSSVNWAVSVCWDMPPSLMFSYFLIYVHLETGLARLGEIRLCAWWDLSQVV